MNNKIKTIFYINLFLFFLIEGISSYAQEINFEDKGTFFPFDSLRQIKKNTCLLPDHPEEKAQKGTVFTSSPNKIFKPKNLIFPATLITVGGIGTAIDEMNDFHLWKRENFKYHTSIDDYAVIGMLSYPILCNIFAASKNTWYEQILLMGIGSFANAMAIHSLKRTINEKRPDHTPYAFPSGHTAYAFLGATIAYHEYKNTHSITAYSGFVLATGVGVMRIINNRHWLSDVIAGAGIGILSAQLAYMVFEPMKSYLKFCGKKGRELAITPSLKSEFGNTYSGINFHLRF